MAIQGNPSQLLIGDNVVEQHSTYKDGLATVDPMTETKDTDTNMLGDQHGLLATAAEGESHEDISQLEKESQEGDTENQIAHVEFKRNSYYEGKNINVTLL